MDFQKYDSTSSANDGAWMHVKHPVTEAPMFDDGKPCRVLVLGIEGRIGAKIMEMQRTEMAGAAPSDEVAQDRLVREAAMLIKGFENIDRGDRPAKAPEDVEWFLRLQVVIGGNKKTFCEQVRAFALARGNYLGND